MKIKYLCYLANKFRKFTITFKNKIIIKKIIIINYNNNQKYIRLMALMYYMIQHLQNPL